MNKQLLFLPLLSLCLVASGCCSFSDFAAFKDASFHDKAYSRIVVLASFEDLGWRSTLEDGIINELTKRSKTSLRSIDIASPTRTWSSKQLDSVFVAAGADALLYITLLSTETKTKYNPSKTETKVVQDNSGSGPPKSRITTTTTPSSTSTSTTKVYQLEVFDLRNQTRMWIATFKTRLSAYGNCEEKLMQFISDKLIADGML